MKDKLKERVGSGSEIRGLSFKGRMTASRLKEAPSLGFMRHNTTEGFAPRSSWVGEYD